MEIVFWQESKSPHLIGLARYMNSLPNVTVTYCFTRPFSKKRLELGWVEEEYDDLRCELINDECSITTILKSISSDAFHICQGLRSCKTIRLVKRFLVKNGWKYWIVSERANDRMQIGIFKRLYYRFLIRFYKNNIAGCFCIGFNAVDWFSKLGLASSLLHHFAYFSHENFYSTGRRKESNRDTESYRLLFVGQFIERKNLKLLFAAISRLPRASLVRLDVVGSGPLELELKTKAQELTNRGVRISWLGSLQMDVVPQIMKTADCLVLPSIHDGWGAVVGEALSVGIEAVCSDACGAAALLSASDPNCIFESKNVNDLVRSLVHVREKSSLEASSKFNPEVISLRSGSDYLIKVLSQSRDDLRDDREIKPPWLNPANHGH